MGLFSSRKHRQKVGQARGGGRSAEDYGLLGLSDEQLQELSGNVGRYGEKGGLAGQELQSRRGLTRDADAYRAALERATYGDAGREYGAGLGRISSYLAGAGPLADSGAATALRTRLAGDIYGRAQGQIGSSYASYLGQLLGQKRAQSYQMQLMKYQQKLNKPKPWDYIAGAVGGGLGTLGGSRGGGGGGGGGYAGYQANDAYYG